MFDGTTLSPEPSNSARFTSAPLPPVNVETGMPGGGLNENSAAGMATLYSTLVTSSTRSSDSNRPPGGGLDRVVQHTGDITKADFADPHRSSDRHAQPGNDLSRGEGRTEEQLPRARQQAGAGEQSDDVS